MQMNEKQKALLEEAIKAGKAGDTRQAQILWIQAHSSKEEQPRQLEERTK